MFEFDIEDIKNELEGMSIEEKIEKLTDLQNELLDAADEVYDTISDIVCEYEEATLDTLNDSLKAFVAQNHWEDLVTIEGPRVIVNTSQGDMYLVTIYDEITWELHISTDFIADNKRRHATLLKLADSLGMNYDQEDDDISDTLLENELHPTIERIITTLCEEKKEEKVL